MRFSFYYATISGRRLRRHKVVRRTLVQRGRTGRSGFDYHDVSFHFTMGAAHKRARQLNRKQGVTA